MFPVAVQFGVVGSFDFVAPLSNALDTCDNPVFLLTLSNTLDARDNSRILTQTAKPTERPIRA